MDLLHYSAFPLTKLNPVMQDNEASHAFKPKGLWVSAGDAWKQWCEDNDFGLNNLKCVSKIKVKNEAKLLVLSKPVELDKLTREYGMEWNRRKDYHMDWETMAENYDGLIIAPYIYQRRLTLMWYYTWDCASGCIWNTVILTWENQA